MPDLLQCPLACGGTVERRLLCGEHFVTHHNLNGCPLVGTYAVSDWNRRQPYLPSEDVEVLREIAKFDCGGMYKQLRAIIAKLEGVKP